MSEPNPEVDAYIRRAKRWQDETARFRELLLARGLREELKWSKPCYTLDGSNVAIIQGFKGHCSLMFFKGSLLADEHGILVSPGPNSQAQMRVEVTSRGQIDELEQTLVALIDQAIDVEREGRTVDFRAKHELELPDELVAKLEEEPDLAAAFGALTPGRQRQYVMHFSSAKRSATRVARIEKAAERILAGKGLTDR